MEERVAELGAAFICADLSLTPSRVTTMPAYIAHWLKVLKDDKRSIFTAAAHAQRAVDFLHGLSSDALAKDGLQPAAAQAAEAA